jgi:Asp-tRNA(Asn)/Glu-tRNA(Gln) amidotransferase A subunit family amidase
MLAELRAGRISPAELADEHLRRIETLNPPINAFVEVYAEGARAAAHNAPSGPLSGIPVSIKDSFHAAGRPTLCGSRFRLGHAATEDATAVRRLREAGAILLGKTNCPEFLANYETDNHVAGRTNNPWNLELTAGGSSGGEAAAIASGMSAGGLGSDGGGSIRWPAHVCGICGLKPTPGRVSAAGHEPPISHPGGLLGVAGPMARTAEDVKLLFAVLAGWDPLDPFSVPLTLRQPRLDGLRVGVFDFGFPNPALDGAARLVEQLGIPVEPFAWPGFDEAEAVWRFFFWRVNWMFLRDAVKGREDEAHWTGLEWFAEAREKPEPTAGEVLDHMAARDRLRRDLMLAMEWAPVLLTPVAGTAAFPHRQRDFGGPSLIDRMKPLTVFNLAGFPAMVIPIEVRDGVPVGVQLVARPFEEELLLELAIRIEQARGPFPPPLN